MVVDWLFKTRSSVHSTRRGRRIRARWRAGGLRQPDSGRGTEAEVNTALEEAGAPRPRQEVDASDFALLPGLIDAHIHTQLGLLRGVAQDMADWMMEGVLPYMLELRPNWQMLSAQLTVMEALKSGTTTFGDFLVFPDPNCSSSISPAASVCAPFCRSSNSVRHC